MKVLSSVQQYANPYNTQVERLITTKDKSEYAKRLEASVHFYESDPIASTVINRMSDLCNSTMRLRRGDCSSLEFAYFESVLELLQPVLKDVATQYFLAGMAIIDYTLTRETGSTFAKVLGKNKLQFPTKIWIRDPSTITLRRMPATNERAVFVRIPQEEIYFVMNEGVFPDGTEDKSHYHYIVTNYPEYVNAIRQGQVMFPLPHVKPILRKILPNNDYPQPYLSTSLNAFKHKERLKELDYSIASKALEAIQLIRAGSDEFPLTEGDTTLQDLKMQIDSRKLTAVGRESVYTLYANHTIDISWVYPPLELLLSKDKYEAPDADIYMGMGFSRVLLVGESAKSNSGSGVTSVIGPLSSLEEARNSIIHWVNSFFKVLMEANKMSNVPTVYYHPISRVDITTLVQNVRDLIETQVVSPSFMQEQIGIDYENTEVDNTVQVTTNTNVPDSTPTGV